MSASALVEQKIRAFVGNKKSYLPRADEFMATLKKKSRFQYMKLLLINLVFCLGLATPLQAQDTLQDSLLVVIPAQFQTETGNPFLTWKEEPKTFEFILCDRWGEIVATTKENPHFILEDLLNTTKTELRTNSTYFIILKFTGADGKERRSQAQSLYFGFYCSG